MEQDLLEILSLLKGIGGITFQQSENSELIFIECWLGKDQYHKDHIISWGFVEKVKLGERIKTIVKSIKLYKREDKCKDCKYGKDNCQYRTDENLNMDGCSKYEWKKESKFHGVL